MVWDGQLLQQAIWFVVGGFGPGAAGARFNVAYHCVPQPWPMEATADEVGGLCLSEMSSGGVVMMVLDDLQA